LRVAQSYDLLVTPGSDAPRLLARDSTRGYTDRPYQALPDEPEAISESEQQLLTERSRREWQAARRERWAEARREIDSALDGFAATVNGDAPLHHALRAVRRSAESVSRRLA
jgi:hypothetical protein